MQRPHVSSSLMSPWSCSRCPDLPAAESLGSSSFSQSSDELRNACKNNKKYDIQINLKFISDTPYMEPLVSDSGVLYFVFYLYSVQYVHVLQDSKR